MHLLVTKYTEALEENICVKSVSDCMQVVSVFYNKEEMEGDACIGT